MFSSFKKRRNFISIDGAEENNFTIACLLCWQAVLRDTYGTVVGRSLVAGKIHDVAAAGLRF